ncbi:hypothetical protein FRC00_010235, partial [Tulasnella sp. 408]
LAEVQRLQSKNAEAELSFIQALAMHESLGDELGRANALRGIGDLRQARSEYVEAETAHTQALSIYENIGNERGRVNATIGLAELRFHQTRYAEARALIKVATGISSRMHYSWGTQTSRRLSDKISGAERRETTDTNMLNMLRHWTTRIFKVPAAQKDEDVYMCAMGESFKSRPLCKCLTTSESTAAHTDAQGQMYQWFMR